MNDVVWLHISETLHIHILEAYKFNRHKDWEAIDMVVS